MKHNQDLLNRINNNYSNMSKGQKSISNYIMSNYDRASYMTAYQLGEKVGVSESTVVRFASFLGYKGYPKLQSALQELIRTKLTTIQRIEMSQELDATKILQSVLKSDMDNINRTIEDINNEIFEDVIDSILSAENIFVLGLRSAAPLAQFMGYYLNFIFSNIKIVTSGVNDVFEQLMHINDKDLLIGISYPRYAVRTVEAMAFAKERGASVVALTDTLLSPLNEYADFTLLARSNMASFVDSLVAPLSLINAIIVGTSLKKSVDISTNFEHLEKVWDKYNVYLNRENN